MSDKLLRSVRDEVRENVHFTPKETDIYKIHQSGDLANLDGLDDTALAKLPSLLKLRDALYSPEFRDYVATVTGAGALSGKKTDMAINVYTPGCHLLCHDDVIGSRRVSYILYLTDPDSPWEEEWGGALRLFPTTEVIDEDGKPTKTPSPDYSKVIPPAWNQLSFFAVQPGESFHDVEEVYHAETNAQQISEGGRIRMAISGWFHIPQVGEEGYIKGAEEKQAAKSSLVQLQSKADSFDFPKETLIAIGDELHVSEEEGFSPEDVDFLLRFMTPQYLIPETLEQIGDHFEEQSAITLDNILSKKFSARLKAYIESEESTALSESAETIESSTPWRVAKPPHKHRFLYQQPNSSHLSANSIKAEKLNPFQELTDILLPSRQFRRWLEHASKCDIENFSILARRFRKGLDYALATSHDGDARLEVCLMVTPSRGWGADEVEEEEEEVPASKPASDTKANGKSKQNGKSRLSQEVTAEDDLEKEPELEKALGDDEDVGGHEVYMAGDDDDSTSDAAIYKSSTDEASDPVLFTVTPAWNKLSIVLRDAGVLKFVKYVSRKANGDRWDVTGVFGVKDEDEKEDEEETKISSQEFLADSGEEEEFNGFSASEESDSG